MELEKGELKEGRGEKRRGEMRGVHVSRKKMRSINFDF